MSAVMVVSSFFAASKHFTILENGLNIHHVILWLFLLQESLKLEEIEQYHGTAYNLSNPFSFIRS